jgi:signal peptidase I
LAKVQGRFETIKTVAVAVALAVIFRSFLYEPFHIPSGSMKDTLLVGDFIFVSKYSYGYSRYSFPLGLPIFEGRMLEGEDTPQRGDIIVFRLPRNPHIDYIKRLIGLPGDRIQMRNGVLYINDKAVPKKRASDYMEVLNGEVQRVRHVPRYQETLPNGVTYHVLDDFDDGEVDNTDVFTVPEGHYFFMGDNRDHSIDSRYTEGVGFVPAENIIGRAEVIALSVEEGHSLLAFWNWGESLRTGRFWQWLGNDEKAEAAKP